ncbi:hypothetical protein V1514DRAFT_274953 [Lipomyces japonicus]|uniref:uncharacterized protein n=1 Tax=Lipomyces japonicus TaxID=56871 RepID=UPI0034CE4CBA
MGKSAKVFKNSLARVSAIRVSKPPSKISSKEVVDSASTVPLIQKLTSTDAKERVLAVSTIAKLLDDSNLRKIFLKEKLIQIIIDRSLSDGSDEVVKESYGILRNLAIEEGHDVCVFLWRKDILSAISITLEKIKVKLDEFANSSNSKNGSTTEKRLIFDLLENIISLLTSLGASSDDIMSSIFSRIPDLAVFELTLLNSKIISENVKVAAAENLYILSEDSHEFIEQIQTSGISLGGDLSTPIEMYINGIQYNISEISFTASIDILDVCKSIVKNIKSVSVEQNLKIIDPNESIESLTADDSTYSEAKNSIIAVQLGLELLTAIAESVVTNHSKKGKRKAQAGNNAKEEEEEVEVDAENDDAEPELNEDEDLDDAMVDYDNEGGVQTSVILEDPVLHYLLTSGLDIVVPLLEFSDLQPRALQALNNMAWTFNSVCPTAPEWLSKAEKLWVAVATILKSLPDDKVDGRTGSIGVLWAIANTFKGQVPFEVSDIRWFISHFQKSSGSRDLLNYRVGTVGLLGVIAAVQGRIDVTKEISIFLITQILALPNNEPQIVIEALNAIYDIFADKEFDYDDEVFVKENLLKRLQGSLLPVRQMAKKIDRRKDLELRTKADEVALNLQRFISYKIKEQKHK